MKIGLSRKGFWVSDRRRLRQTRFSWWYPLVFFLLLIITACSMVLAINRQEHFLNFLARGLWNESALVFYEYNRAAILNNIFLEPDRAKSGVPTLELTLTNNTLPEMHEAILKGDPEKGREEGGNKPWFKALYKDESGKWQRCNISTRGVLEHHHKITKPSLRVKIKREDIRLGSRYVELIRAETPLGLSNWIPDQMARHLNMITASTEIVRLYINGKYYGIYQRADRASESLAIKNKRLPGLFLKGDHLDHSNPDPLWRSHQLWKKFGETDERYVQVFKKLLENISRDGQAEELWNYLDKDTLAKWSALTISCNSSHADYVHNHMLYFDSGRGKFEVMPWDTNAFLENYRSYLNHVPIDLNMTPLINKAFEDPDWVHMRNKYLYRLAMEFTEPERFAKRIEDQLQKYWLDLKSDPNLIVVELRRIVGQRQRPIPVTDLDEHKEKLFQFNLERRREILDYLHQADFSLKPDSGSATETTISVFGNTAVRCYWKGQSVMLFPGKRLGLARPNDGRFIMEKQPQKYLLQAPAQELLFTNAITDKAIEPAGWRNSFDELRARNMTFESDSGLEEVRLGPGLVELNEDLFIPESKVLKVLPGTTLSLAPGVQIISKGRVDLQGLLNQPIVIKAAGYKPWGTFAVFGPSTKGSIFKFVKMKGGSTGNYQGAFFKGMLSVYQSSDLQMSHCTFGENQVGDDSVNLADSTFRISHCIWMNARSDALDLDQANGSISDSSFKNSGNDGLDLMSSQVTVENCFFQLSGDKGISIGENSRATVMKSQVFNCHIGIEVKDASRVEVTGTHFKENMTAIHAYQKKWEYMLGGLVHIRRCRFDENELLDVNIKKSSYASVDFKGHLKAEGLSRINRQGLTYDLWLNQILKKHAQWMLATN